MRSVVPIVVVMVVVVVLLAGCPAAEEDPGEGVRETFEQALEFIRRGEYDRLWSLYSIEFQQKIEEDLEKQKAGIRRALAENLYDVEEWTMKQTGMTPKQYLAASAREILSAQLKISGSQTLRSRIEGKILVEGDYATARIVLPPADVASKFRFVRRNGRWLYYERDFMPAK